MLKIVLYVTLLGTTALPSVNMASLSSYRALQVCYYLTELCKQSYGVWGVVEPKGRLNGSIEWSITGNWQVQPEGVASLAYLHRLLTRSAKPRDSAP